MGIFPSMSKIMRKAKYLFLLLLCLCVVAWIATFSNDDTVKTAQEGSNRPDNVKSGFRQLELESEMMHSIEEPVEKHVEERIEEERLEEREDELVMEHVEEQFPKQSCPEHSPLLRGSLKLSFESSLTMEQVESENEEVVDGQYNPSDCTARQSVAILIPHRNREKHLLYLLYHLHPFLQRQQLHYAIYVIHQAGDATFNRAKLLNVGYLEALKDQSWDCFIFHDVDLVPENDHNLYMCGEQPKHLVVGRNSTGYKLRYKGYFGGVSAMTMEQFHKVNGFPNTYWGWGGEDDDLRIRVQLQKMTIMRPSPGVARYTMVFHKRDSGNQINKNRMQLLRRTPQMWQKDGLNSCSYKVLSVDRSTLFVNITVDIGQPERAH
ncbi:beta-1,4-galactosyltransferase 4 [Pseudorasbora parva]|uniref:beta-1,4-galactosyltransferase 4 n=1 Tax=Pseudorasbora parva TaxID=51549 RepID=UPI00351E4AC8